MVLPTMVIAQIVAPMTSLERAARALCTLDGNPENATMDGKPLWQDYLPEARAVLGALREPSPAMIEAGSEITSHIASTESSESFAADAANVWRVMVGVALSER